MLKKSQRIEVLDNCFVFVRVHRPLDKNLDVPFEFTDYRKFALPKLHE